MSQMITDSTFYTKNKLHSYGIYDTSHKYWIRYVLYTNGKIKQTEKLDPVTFFNIDTSYMYHLNGNIAWILPFTDGGYLNGSLIGYYGNGSIFREAHYYRHFRTGTWKEYYQNGQIRSISYYQISKEDSAFARNFTSQGCQNRFVELESFTWGEEDSLKSENILFLGKTTLQFPTLISKKTGIWKMYDSSGKIISKTEYKN